MTDRQKIAALCDAVRALWCPALGTSYPDFLWWDGVGGVLTPSKIKNIHHLVETCEERDEVVPVTEEESIDF